MTILEICQYEVKQEIDKMQNEGISRNEASKELARFFSEILKQEVKSETIRKKDQRARKKLGTNVPTSKPIFNKSDIEWTDYTWNPVILMLSDWQKVAAGAGVLQTLFLTFKNG